jgi:alkaline phosphatase D
VGQGWGIDLARGGLRSYESMRRFDPDVFVHCGDTIYADTPLSEAVVLEDGAVWRDVVTPAKAKVAETLDEFRGNYLYNLLDENVRRFNAETAQVALWDDHEVLNTGTPASGSRTIATRRRASPCWPPAASGPSLSTSRSAAPPRTPGRRSAGSSRSRGCCGSCVPRGCATSRGSPATSTAPRPTASTPTAPASRSSTPFWEFVAGPLHAGTFGPAPLDPTFGPERRFLGIPAGMKPNRPPSEGLQFFGTLEIDPASRLLTARLHDASGRELFSEALAPEPTG